MLITLRAVGGEAIARKPVHELTGALYYLMARRREERGAFPTFEEAAHAGCAVPTDAEVADLGEWAPLALRVAYETTLVEHAAAREAGSLLDLRLSVGVLGYRWTCSGTRGCTGTSSSSPSCRAPRTRAEPTGSPPHPSPHQYTHTHARTHTHTHTHAHTNTNTRARTRARL